MMIYPYTCNEILERTSVAIIRFLDKNNNCYQVSTPDTPILIYLDPKEKKLLQKSTKGKCIILIDKNLSQEETDIKTQNLNTVDIPRTMNG